MTLKLNYTAERNPVISIEFEGNITNKILCIGDPHLGRRFITGVPSHRLYEREETQYAELDRLLNPSDPLIDHIVIMGDLFDRFVVSPTTVLRAVELLRKASEANSHIEYFVIPGNHDMTKDTTKKSSYQLFYEVFSYDWSILEVNRNVAFNTPMSHFIYPDFNGNPNVYVGLYFEAYNAFRLIDYNMAISDHYSEAPLKIAFGHWDSVDIISSGYLPSADLLADSDLVVSGHEHTYKQTFYPSHPNTPVLFTGSLQPYSHAEDPDKKIYVTVKSEDLDNYDLSKDFKYKCLRIECTPSFALIEAVDCYSLAYKVIVPDAVVSSTTDESDVIQSYSERLSTWLAEQDLEDSVRTDLENILTTKEYLD